MSKERSGCKQAITGYKPYDWVAWWACEWAASQTDDKSIVNVIYDSLRNSGTTGPETQVQYDFPPTGTGDSARDVLVAASDPAAKSACGDFSEFLIALCRTHSITVTTEWSDLVDISAVPGHPADIDNWWESAECYATVASVLDVDGDSGPYNADGTAGTEGRWIFGTHCFCVYDGEIYDPSFRDRHFTAAQLPGPGLALYVRYFMKTFEYFAFVKLTAPETPVGGHPAAWTSCYATTNNTLMDWVHGAAVAGDPDGDHDGRWIGVRNKAGSITIIPLIP